MTVKNKNKKAKFVNRLFRDLEPILPSGNSPALRKFAKFHRENPHVYRHLRDYARKLMAQGYKRWSIAGLFEVLRYGMAIQTVTNDRFRLSNDYKPLYARMLMLNEDDLDGFFILKKLKRPLDIDA
jgi:hypothetical protein